MTKTRDGRAILEELRGKAAPTDEYEKGFTDYGNAERLVERHGGDVRYCRERKAWYVWDERRWAPDIDGEIDRRAKDTVRHIYHEAGDEDDAARRKATAKWARASESARRLADMVKIATTEKLIVVAPAELDADPWLFGCLNGVLDLDAGKVLPFDRKYLITKVAPVEYDPDATFELWDTYLETAMDGDAELIGFLRRYAGCSLTALPADDDRFVFCHGPPGGGKSTFAEAIRATFGTYARAANFDTIVTHYNPGSPRGDIARLHDARLVTMVEIPDEKRLDETLLAQLTGGDTITSCFKYQNEFEYEPKFKLWVFGNNEPTIKSGDSPIWRRLLKVPFTNVIPEADRDGSVKATLRRDPRAHAAILAWAVRGCVEWQERGLDPPERVTSATATYRATQNELAEFIENCCIVGAEHHIDRDALYREYVAWAESLRLPLRDRLPLKTFTRRINADDRFEKKIGSYNKATIYGIALVDNTHPELDGLDKRTADDGAEAVVF